MATQSKRSYLWSPFCNRSVVKRIWYLWLFIWRQILTNFYTSKLEILEIHFFFLTLNREIKFYFFSFPIPEGIFLRTLRVFCISGLDRLSSHMLTLNSAPVEFFVSFKGYWLAEGWFLAWGIYYLFIAYVTFFNKIDYLGALVFTSI